MSERIIAEVAFEWGLHARTRYEMGELLRDKVKAQPVRDFSGLEPGKTYLYEPYSGARQAIYTVLRRTPSGKQVVARCHCKGGDFEDRLNEARYRRDTFIEMSADLMALAGVDHGAIITEAVRRGLDVPARVRVENPTLFVEIPERFDAERVRRMLHPDWNRYLTAEALAEMIEREHSELNRIVPERQKALALNPNREHLADWDRYAGNHRDSIDLFRWLQTHVAPGGIFHVETAA